MKNKLLLTFSLFLAICTFLGITSSSNAATPTYDPDDGYVLNGSQKCFFANGTPITISSRADGIAGATISWEGGSTNVPSDVNVFGAAHADPATYDTKITMNGGTVKNIFGGGLHESYVGTSEVIVNAGTVTGSITAGGANVLANSDNCTPTAENATGSATRVVNANLVINGGSALNVFGGGEGLGYTKASHTSIHGGNFGYVTAGGSNGYTGNANLVVTNGEIGIMQSVNRGNIESANMGVSGGTIEKLYVGGEEGDSNVTGNIDAISLDISGNATVKDLYLGTNGGQLIGTNGNDAIVQIAIYDGANVHIADPSQFSEGMIINYIYVSIDDIRYELEKGKTLTDLGEDILSTIKSVNGKEFVKFVVKGTDNEFSETTPIDADIELSTIFKDNTPIKDNTPKTGAYNVVIFIAVAIFTISLVGFAITKRIIK